MRFVFREDTTLRNYRNDTKALRFADEEFTGSFSSVLHFELQPNETREIEEKDVSVHVDRNYLERGFILKVPITTAAMGGDDNEKVVIEALEAAPPKIWDEIMGAAVITSLKYQALYVLEKADGSLRTFYEGCEIDDAAKLMWAAFKDMKVIYDNTRLLHMDIKPENILFSNSRRNTNDEFTILVDPVLQIRTKRTKMVHVSTLLRTAKPKRNFKLDALTASEGKDILCLCLWNKKICFHIYFFHRTQPLYTHVGLPRPTRNFRAWRVRQGGRPLLYARASVLRLQQA